VNTQTHLLLASALLGRRATPKERSAILAGAFLPDLSIFALAAWAAATGVPGEEVWGNLYWSEGWQLASMVSNSAPLWAALLAAGALAGQRWLVLLAGGALLHLACDFPLHVEDAHAHLWPLTEWRFRSAVSYWDPAHHGRLASIGEAALGLTLVAVLWRRHAGRVVRALLVLCALAYLAVPAFWLWTLG
jgi:hypothetical protein